MNVFATEYYYKAAVPYIYSIQQFHFEMANILTKALELNVHSKYGITSTNF